MDDDGEDDDFKRNNNNSNNNKIIMNFLVGVPTGTTSIFSYGVVGGTEWLEGGMDIFLLIFGRKEV
jgi:hypothetical protein